MSDLTEPIFGSWYVEKEIGSGAFGTVYKIKREDYGNTYYSALKVIKIPSESGEISTLRSEGMDDMSITSYYREIVQSLVNEISILNSLKGNSNIVSYEDHKIDANENETQFTIYIRMELLTPLKDYLADNEIDDLGIIKLGLDMCNALKLCEKNNIIHRDIKPDNIFVSDNGDFKLGDFGVARTVEKTMSQLSKKGTYTYMAPEVYLGREYGKAADIYSLGLILYQLLNHNRAPFLPEYPKPITFNDREGAMKRRMNAEEVPDIKGIPQSLNLVVKKACAFKPEDRFATAEEMYQALIKARDAYGKEKDEEKLICVMEYAGGDLAGEKPQTPAGNAGSIGGAADGGYTGNATGTLTQQNNGGNTTGALVARGNNAGTLVTTPGNTAVTIENTVKKNSILESFEIYMKNYANFKGRTRRSDYWNVFLINTIIFSVISLITGLTGFVLLAFPLIIYMLATLVPTVALSVRRLHDIGKNGVYLLMSLIPIAGVIIMIIWFTKDSQLEENQYGKNPKIK